MTFHARLLGVWHVASQLADREEIHVSTITSMHGSSDQRCQEKHQNQKNAYLTIDKECDIELADRTHCLNNITLHDVKFTCLYVICGGT